MQLENRNPEEGHFNFEVISPEEADIDLPEVSDQPVRRGGPNESDYFRDHELTLDEILEIQNRSKNNSLFFCACQMVILFMLSKLMLKIDLKSNGLQHLKYIETLLREEDDYNELHGDRVRSVHLTYWYVQVNLYLYCL